MCQGSIFHLHLPLQRNQQDYLRKTGHIISKLILFKKIYIPTNKASAAFKTIEFKSVLRFPKSYQEASAKKKFHFKSFPFYVSKGDIVKAEQIF